MRALSGENIQQIVKKNSQAHPEKAVDALISQSGGWFTSENRTAIAVKKQQLPKATGVAKAKDGAKAIDEKSPAVLLAALRQADKNYQVTVESRSRTKEAIAAEKSAKQIFETIQNALIEKVKQRLVEQLKITDTIKVAKELSLASGNITDTMLDLMSGINKDASTKSVQSLLTSLGSKVKPFVIISTFNPILADARKVTSEQIAQVITGIVDSEVTPPIVGNNFFGNAWEDIKHWLISPNPFAVLNPKLSTSERLGQPAIWGTLRIAVPFAIGMVNPVAGIVTAGVSWGWDGLRLASLPIRTFINWAARTQLAKDFILGERIITILNDTNPSGWRMFWKAIWTNPTVMNILAGSREGFFEYIFNATLFAIGDPIWSKPGITNKLIGVWEAIAQTVVVVTTRGAGYFIAGPFGEFNPFRIWDNYRIARWYAESVNSTSEVKYHSPLRNLPITLPDYWRMDGYVLGFIPRSLLNATPRIIS